ncbi:MAG TPA: alginate lyase family protein [Pyrinomonadaceae bacterium]|nr:alginate lyase family protein [Pyrinomonadaceae bacterium]
MNFISKIKKALRGEVDTRAAAQEAARRARGTLEQRRERASLDQLNEQPARLREEFARVRASDLLAHFRSRVRPKFFPGFADPKRTADLQRQLFPAETASLIERANRIVEEHCWPLLGFGEKCFGKQELQWNRDPLSGFDWPIEYHPDIELIRNDGSDARVIWELNRLSHLVTLGRAYAVTNYERFSQEFLKQLGSWRAQNPVGRGINWSCAMEVSLRAMNLLAAFALFLRSPQLDEFALKEQLQMFDQHGAHIQRNLEFSHIATSNHYLCDVAGLLWLGVMLPELEAASEWREFGLRELLAEMNKQILPDGADWEASTGYHRLKAEVFLYSFVLCHLNGIDIEEKYWTKLRGMIEYMRAYLRPDGRAPLIGDSDNGRILAVADRAADDHEYVIAAGATVFQDSNLKIQNSKLPEEVLWILGERGVTDFDRVRPSVGPASSDFPNAGVYLLRDDGLYLLFNCSDSGMNGRGSHGHNDALSIEVSACGVPFIIDPGSYVYTANLHERHLFRSTAYHSTVQVDGEEQNSIDESVPFVIGNEAKPRVLKCDLGADVETIVAEHEGYQRLSSPVTHRRTVRFEKTNRYWTIEDELIGEGTHDLAFRFHVAPGLEVRPAADQTVKLKDPTSGARLVIRCQKPDRPGGQVSLSQPELESQFSSTDYGTKEESVSVCWKTNTTLPFALRFLLIPICAGEDGEGRLAVVSVPGAIATG